MSNYIDLSNKELPTLRVILPRKRRFFKSRKLVLDVYTPTKSTREMFMFLGETLIKISKGEATEEDVDNLYSVTARILSRNKQNTTVSQDILEERLEIEDIVAILETYANFLTGAIESKN